MLVQNHLDGTETNQSETVIFAQDDGSTWAVHLEHRLTAISDHVNVRRAMVIGVNRDT